MLNKLVSVIKAQCFRTGGDLDYMTWIFSSVDNNCFNYNSKYLFLYVREHLPQIHPLFVINDPEKRKRLGELYGEECFVDGQRQKGLRRILAAGVWFTSAGLPAYEWTSHPGRIVVNLWHGIPLKKIVLLQEHVGGFQKLYFQRIFGRKYTDILTTSRELVPVMAQSFGVSPSVVRVWGQPRNDAIFLCEHREELMETFGLGDRETRLILYAPTYREYGQTRLFPFEDYDPGSLESLLEEQNICLCIRLHLDERSVGDLASGGRIRFVNEDILEDIAEYLNCFDALITDYSSIYLDYLLLDRPMIFLPYDKEIYLKNRGMNFDYEEVTPGPKPTSQREFARCLLEIRDGQALYAEKRKSCNRYFNQVTEPCCGQICAHILDRICQKGCTS